MHYTIINVRDHYEVYDNYGNFLFSADTKSEAINEMSE